MASKEAVAKVVQKIFGTAPQLNIRTGNKYLKKPLIGAYLSRYYPEPIEKFARMVRWDIFYFGCHKFYNKLFNLYN